MNSFLIRRTKRSRIIHCGDSDGDAIVLEACRVLNANILA